MAPGQQLFLRSLVLVLLQPPRSRVDALGTELAARRHQPPRGLGRPLNDGGFIPGIDLMPLPILVGPPGAVFFGPLIVPRSNGGVFDFVGLVVSCTPGRRARDVGCIAPGALGTLAMLTPGVRVPSVRRAQAASRGCRTSSACRPRRPWRRPPTWSGPTCPAPAERHSPSWSSR